MEFDPTTEAFWDQDALHDEMQRQFDVCHGCRLCWNLCPSFPALFDAVDEHPDEVAGLTDAEERRVTDLCYQCKLCNVKCPYTEPHEYALDIPRLLLRARAVRAKAEGVTLQDRVLGQTDLVGKIGSAVAPVMNWANKNHANRWLMHHTIGIHRQRQLPEYTSQTFSTWHEQRGDTTRAPVDDVPPPVALFTTCSVEYNTPEVGRACVEVLEHNGVKVRVPSGQRCCGMPFLDGGDIDSTVACAKANLEQFKEHVEAGGSIVSPGPTCTYMLKEEYPLLVKGELAEHTAKATLDICEYLIGLKRNGQLRTDFAVPAGDIAYHVPCHLRAQHIGYKSRDLMELLPETTVNPIEHCSGVDGTWGLKTEYFDLSQKVSEKLIRAVKEEDNATAVSDCPLASLEIHQSTGRKPVHPIQVVHQAYGLAEASSSHAAQQQDGHSD